MNTSLKYIVFFYCVGSLDAVKFWCDYNHYGVGWFKYYEIPMTWNDARIYCQIQGAKLASPTYFDIRTAILNLTTRGDVFTGFHSTYTKGQFYSLDGTPLSNVSHTWAKSEPDNKEGLEKCIVLNAEGDMSDVKCEELKPFVCHRKKSSVHLNECGTMDSEYKLSNVTNKCYKIHTKPKNFTQANFICSAEGGHLAIINNEEEAKVVGAIHGSTYEPGSFFNEASYIGFEYWIENAQWITIHDQTLQQAGYTEFVKKELDIFNPYRCGAVNSNGLLTTLNCGNVNKFICEKEPNFPLICDH